MASAKKFWDWFEKNNAKYLVLNQVDDEDERERLLDEFLEKLHAYCPDIFFEIGGQPDERQDLIITAGGNLDYFSEVETLVSAAPQLEDWNIIAFKPPFGEDFVIGYEGADIDTKAAWFTSIEQKDMPEMFGIRIYTPNYDPSLEDEFVNAALLALDGIIGEKSTAMDVHHVEVMQLKGNPEEQRLVRITELPKFMTWRKEKLKIK